MKSLTITLLALASVLPARAAGTRPPNVIILLVDDLGYHDLGFQGSTEVKSPNIDKLAAGGVIFTDAHVSASVCSPSRAGLITGRYQQRFGHEANSPPTGLGMSTTETTMGNAFQKIGYKTAAIGKWHLGNDDARYPTRRGFDEFWGLREGHRSYFYKPKADDRPGSLKAIEHNGKPLKFKGYLTDWLGDTAVDFIADNKEKPFFLYLSFTAPHEPIEAKPEDLEILKTTNQYHAMIYAVDRAVGKLVAKLEADGLMENTIIWFLSDNGGINQAASNIPLAGKKGTLFEGGMRVPFVLHWQGRVPAGKRESRTVSSLDILPTSLLAAGGKLPTDRPLDGVNLLPFLTGKNTAAPHPAFFWRRTNIAASREGPWKLIRVRDLGEALYNLDDDLGEKHNLVKSNPEKAATLRKALETWETQLIPPLWEEGARWDKWRKDYHQALFEGRQPPAE